VSLESIIETYGWEDYLDMGTNRIYQLTEAIDNKDGTTSVPVIDTTGYFIGYVKVNKVKEVSSNE